MDKSNHQRSYEFEKFRLDVVRLMLYENGKEITLAPKAVETLLALIVRRGEIVGKDELMEIIWTDSIVEESNLAKYLHVLRKTLGNQQNGKPFIETFRRRGYRFNGEVKTGEPSATKSEAREKSPEIVSQPAPQIEIPTAKSQKFLFVGAAAVGLLILALGFWALTRLRSGKSPRRRNQSPVCRFKIRAARLIWIIWRTGFPKALSTICRSWRI